ncbi:aldo/keto reductase [Schleiferilactobacillus harbinensis]|jgi:L-glyceraldehyde 3-phosphate reductase|uniref:aldo/keto reductase n=1 Tax=Schleiferilactobacillus harbinensis TaxID=304207 RepID=UPI0024319137|nr:aldo/keto reductase [Schleiferilactobacillus harbinensis]MCI1851916.1 aldo/keto reductase [Schleiferilactobacillus harbinensis]
MTEVYRADDTRYDNRTAIRRAGDTGLQLPAVSLGLWRHYSSSDPVLDREKVILKAFDEGVFSFDLSNNYGKPEIGSAERLFGDIYRRNLRPYRDELVITTKVGFKYGVGPYGEFGSRKAVMQSIDTSLEKMGLDYVDIYYSHRPDPKVKFEETARALDAVVRAGKALYIGISNYTAAQTKEMVGWFQKLGTPFVVNQVSYNMFNRTAEKDNLLTTMKDLDAGLVAYGPLSEGLLSDRYLAGIPADFPIHWSNTETFAKGKDHVVAQLNDLKKIAQNRGQTLSEMALSWLLRDPVVTSVIIGTTSVDHLESNIKAGNQTTFTADELAAIEAILNR